MNFKIEFEKQVLKYLSKIDKEISRRIIEKIEKLKNNPFPQDSKRIVNTKDKVFRIRVGEFRVLYRIKDNQIIIIFLIDKRSKIYKNKI